MKQALIILHVFCLCSFGAESLQKAYFAGGCFWGVEYYLEQLEGVHDVVSGYMGGRTSNPTYRDVTANNTGHYESVEVTFDPKRVSYEEIARLFFEIHDPTQRNGQGPDIGTQYRSALFYVNAHQQRIAKRLVALLKAKEYDVATQILPYMTFYKAEEYHQDYYVRHHKKPYCHAYTKRF